jgi:peptide deformylase
MSCGTGDDILYAQVPRHTSVKIKWTDEFAKQREEVLEGFAAHVAQHETDHTNGILFLDKVEDTSSYMMADEYRKRVSGKDKNKEE